MPDFPYRLSNRKAVSALIAAVKSDPAFVAACLVCGGAHGYSLELEYMQRSDGTTRYRTWDDVQGIISTGEKTVSVDFAGVLANVRAAGLAETKFPDEPMSRRSVIVLATADGGTWVDTPTLGKEQRAKSPLGPIFDLVFP